MILGLFAALAVIAIAVIVALNFYPPLKAKVEKYLVVAEGVIATGTWLFGQVTDALHQAQEAGYIPSQLLGYLPYIFLAYLLIKQFQGAFTKAPPAVTK